MLEIFKYVIKNNGTCDKIDNIYDLLGCKNDIEGIYGKFRRF